MVTTAIVSNLCYDRGTACTGSTAHSGSDEDHVGTFYELLYIILLLVGSILAYLWIAAGAQAMCGLAPQGQLGLGLAPLKSLKIGVGRNEYNILPVVILYDSVDCIASCATYTYNLDYCTFHRT